VLARAQLLPILGIVVCVLGSLVTRAARWQVFFLPEDRVPFGPLLGTLSISYMASTFLPLRAGELVRAVLLGQRASLPVPRVVGTILLEKLFDFLAIGVLLIVLLVLLRNEPIPPGAQVAGGTIAGVILAGFGFVVGLAVWREPTLRFVSMLEKLIPFQAGERLGLARAARQFASGTDSLRVPRLWLLLLLWTAVTWVFSVASAWMGSLALGAQPGLPALLFLTVLTSTGQAVPSSPGYVGVFHAAATLALTTFGIDAVTALGIAVITHAFSYGTLVVAGLISLWTGGYSVSDIVASLRGTPPATVTARPVAPDP
jgi:uncharacterized protein (TIRG00374 family)